MPRDLTDKVAAALRLAATNLWRSQTALGTCCRRMCSRPDKPGAFTATAHKIARPVYSMLKNGTEYTDQGMEYYEMQYRQRVTESNKKYEKKPCFKLVEATDTGNADNVALSKF